MSRFVRLKFRIVIALAVIVSGAGAKAQAQVLSSNELPNPYKTVANWAQLPEGRKWGAVTGVSVGPDGNIWVADRCGANTCDGFRRWIPSFEFDPSGKMLKNFGAGIFVAPHGFHVDSKGNIWVTDSNANAKEGKGVQVFEFSPDGKILMTR